MQSVIFGLCFLLMLVLNYSHAMVVIDVGYTKNYILEFEPINSKENNLVIRVMGISGINQSYQLSILSTKKDFAITKIVSLQDRRGLQNANTTFKVNDVSLAPDSSSYELHTNAQVGDRISITLITVNDPLNENRTIQGKLKDDAGNYYMD